jgi:hypothetical protein
LYSCTSGIAIGFVISAFSVKADVDPGVCAIRFGVLRKNPPIFRSDFVGLVDLEAFTILEGEFSKQSQTVPLPFGRIRGASVRWSFYRWIAMQGSFDGG